MMAAAKAKAEEAKARALANAAILQQRAATQQQQQQSAPQAPASGGLSQLELIRQRKEALQAKLSKVLPSTPTAASVSGSRGAAMPTTTAAQGSGVMETRAKGGLGMDMMPMISRDAEGNLIINSVTSGKAVKTPSFATAKVNYCNRKEEAIQSNSLLAVLHSLLS
jgi:hypothetical protein